MAFTRVSGKTKVMWLPVTASTVIADGALVAFSSGLLVPAANTLNSYDVMGVCRKTIAATDSDYATSARLIPVEVPVEKNVVFKAPVSAGTLATTSVGGYFDLGTDDAGTSVAQNGTSLHIVQCVKFISATLGHFVLNVGADARLKANS